MTELASLELRIQSLEVTEAEKRLDRLSAASLRTEKAADGVTRGSATLSKTAQVLNNHLEEVVKTVLALGSGFLAFEGLKRGVEVVENYDKAVARISASTDIVGQDLSGLAGDLRRLSSEIGTPIERLLALANTAGQVGAKGAPAILHFVEAVARLEKVSPELGQEETIQSIAKLLSLTGQGVEDIDLFGAAVRRLGKEGKATDESIVRTATNLSSATATFRLTAAELAAISATLVEVAPNASRSGPIIEDLFVNIRRAVDEGGESLERFSALTGQTGDEFRNAFAQSRGEVFESFIEGVANAIRAGRSIADVLAEVGIESNQALIPIGALATRVELLRQNMKLAKDDIGNAAAVSADYAKLTQGLDDAIIKLTNDVKSFVIDNLSGLVEGLKETVTIGADVLRFFRSSGTESEKTSAGVATLAVSLRGLAAAALAFAAVQLPSVIASAAGALRGFLPLGGIAAAALAGAAISAYDFKTAIAAVGVVLAAPHILKYTKELQEARAASTAAAVAEQTRAAASVASLQATAAQIAAQRTLSVGTHTTSDAIVGQTKAEIALAQAYLANLQTGKGFDGQFIKRAEAQKLIIEQTARIAAAEKALALANAGTTQSIIARAEAESVLAQRQIQRLATGRDPNGRFIAQARLQKEVLEQTERLKQSQLLLDQAVAAGNISAAQQAALQQQEALVKAQLTVETNALAAANTRLAAATTLTGAATNFLSRAFVAAKAAAVGFFASFAANPIGATIVALSLIIPLLYSFKAASDDAADAQKRLAEERIAAFNALPGVSRGQAEEEAALRTGAAEAQIKAIETQISALQDFQVALIEFDNKANSIKPDRTFKEFAEKIGLTAEQVAEIKTNLTDKLTNAISSAVESAARQGLPDDPKILQGIDLQFPKDLLRKNLQESLKFDPQEIVDIQANDKIGRLFLQSVLPNNAFRAKAQEELKTLLASLVSGLPQEQALTLTDAQIAEQKRRIDELRKTSTNAPGKGVTDEQIAKRAELSALQAQLALELQFIKVSREEVALQTKLAEVRKKAVEAGFNKDEIQSRVEAIEALLRGIDAGTKAGEESDKRKEAKKSLDEYLVSLRHETELMKLRDDEAEIQRELDTAIAKQREAGIRSLRDVSGFVAIIAFVRAEIAERQKLQKVREEETKAAEEAKRTLEEFERKRQQDLERTVADAHRSLEIVRREFIRLTEDLAEQRVLNIDERELGRALGEIKGFAEKTRDATQAIKERRDAQLSLAKTELQEIEAIREYNRSLAQLTRDQKAFNAGQLELSRLKVIAELAQDGKDLDRSFAAFFRSDRENRIEAQLEGIRTKAEELFAIIEKQRELGLVSEETLQSNQNAVARFVEDARKRILELENLSQIREVAKDISDSFGSAFKSVITGTKSASEAAREMVNAIRDSLLDKAFIQPLTDNLQKALTGFGANIFGIDSTGSDLNKNAQETAALAERIALEDGASLQRNAQALATAGQSVEIMQAGANIVAATIINAARTAAALLAGASGFSGGGGSNAFTDAPTRSLSDFGAPSGLDLVPNGTFAFGGFPMDRGASANARASHSLPSYAAGAMFDRPTVLVAESTRGEGLFPLGRGADGTEGVLALMRDEFGRQRTEALPPTRFGDGTLGVEMDPRRFAPATITNDNSDNSTSASTTNNFHYKHTQNFRGGSSGSGMNKSSRQASADSKRHASKLRNMGNN